MSDPIEGDEHHGSEGMGSGENEIPPAALDPNTAPTLVSEPSAPAETSPDVGMVDDASAGAADLTTLAAEPPPGPAPPREPATDVGQDVAPPPAEPPKPIYPVNPPRPPDPDFYVGQGQKPWALIIMIVVMLLGGLATLLHQPKRPKKITAELIATVADLVPVHSKVTVAGEPVRELRRLAKGDVVETNGGGRARVRLDGGTSIILDGETKITITPEGVALDKGRVFVTNGPAKATIDLGAGSVVAVGSSVGIERRERTKVYVANGEVTARASGKEAVVKTGETADLTSGLEVAPERGYDDWTGGLAAPWSASGSKRAIAEIWGRSQPGQVGSPLTIRTQTVNAIVHGEIAETKVSTTFFNAGEVNVLGDYRMGLPAGAIVSGFEVTRNGTARLAGSMALARRDQLARFETQSRSGAATLEWAGEGWVRGTIPGIPPGQAVTVVVSYVEWLPVRPKDGGHVVQYRYPLAGEGAAPLVGEFFISVDAATAEATALAAGMGAAVKGTKVELRKSDFRASADFVVEVEIPKQLAAARGVIAEEASDEEATFVVRTEIPRLTGTAEEGVTLAVVLDTSASIDPALLDASRAFVEALTKSLGEEDRLVVLAADTVARPIGPPEIGKVDAQRREATIAALEKVALGGATDLGRAIEAGADALPADVSSGMVVYVGDGWGSVGDRSAEAIKARLARRKAGAPRIGAVLVGPSGNKRTFAELTRGSGPLVDVGDSQDAAAASVSLLEKAIVPTVTGITVDLGPDVSRVYPRDEVAAPQGSSFMVVGKLSAEPPKSMTLTYRAGGKTVTETRPISIVRAVRPDDVRRRWADARAQAMALAGRGREAVTNAALDVGLLTPWTAWTTAGGAREYVSSPLSTRVLELSGAGSGYDIQVGGGDSPTFALAGPEDAILEAGSSSLEEALHFGAIRTINEARASLRQCRDTRAQLRPDLPGAVQITLKLDGDGRATEVVVNNAGDATLATCITTIVSNLPYPRVGGEIQIAVAHTIVWPPIETLRGKKCSPTSTLAVPLRRGVWRERIDQSTPGGAYVEARRGCEVASWTAKRAFLELALTVLAERGSPSLPALALARELEDAGDAEAAAFLRKEALRRATPAELRAVRQQLLASERLPWGEFASRYEKATADKDRLAVVRTFLALAPHDPRLRGRLMALLGTLGEKEALIDEVRRMRDDPFVDATLIADGAHLLRTIGLEDDARRTYGEIAERATQDPWAHAMLGDRLRDEGWYDDATAVYRALEDLVPQDAATQIRLALAHFGARRIDVALRILDRVARTGGRSGEPELADLAERASQTLVRFVLAKTEVAAADKTRLERALAEMASLPTGTAFLVQSPSGFDPVNVYIERGPDDAREFVRPRAIASKIGLVALHLESNEPSRTGRVFLSLARAKALPPSAPFKVTIYAVDQGKLVTTELELPSSGDRMEVDFDSGAFGAARVAPPAATASPEPPPPARPPARPVPPGRPPAPAPRRR